MKFGLEAMNHIVEKIYNRRFPYIDNVIIGDNSSGKTLLLKLFIDKVLNDKAVYFIDAVNRGFDVKKVSRTGEKPKYKKTILETRLQETYFNLDINDYPSVSEVQIVFERLFRKQTDMEPSLEHVLRRLLNNKMNQAWGGQDEVCLAEIERQKLTASQQLIVRQIREW